MKKIILFSALAAASCAPSVAHAMTVERVNEYIAVCKAANATELRGKALAEYVKAQWPTYDEAIENVSVCIAYSHGKIDGAREMADRLRDVR